MVSPEPLEYDCRDCGIHVYAFGLLAMPDPPRCGTCETLHALPKATRDELRPVMLDEEGMAYWARHGAYVDEDYPLRLCDICRKPYRGPALYCSGVCAGEDA